MIDGIVFDKDGTLFDFNATWGAWARTMLETETRGDAALLDRLAGVLGYDLDAGRFRPGSVVIASTVDETADAMLEVLGGDKAALIARMKDAAQHVPQQEAAPLKTYFGALKTRGWALGIATNDNEVTARRHLETAGVLGAFDFVAGYDSGHGGKPAPGQLLAFCAATGVRPDRAMMVGDSLHDLHAGRAAGMICVGVLTGPAPAEELAPHADVVLASIGDLPGWIDAQ